MVLKLPWAQKQMNWAFEKGIFQFFANFWVTKVKTFSGKARQCCKNFFHKVYFAESFKNTFKVARVVNLKLVFKIGLFFL